MKCFIHLGCHPHPQFQNAPVSQQAMGCVLGLEACNTHVPSPCFAHRLPLEISYLLLLLVFPLFWPESPYNALSPQPVWAEPCYGLPPPPWEPWSLLWPQSSKNSYTLTADTGFSNTWLHKEHNHLLFSRTSLCSKAKGIQIDQSCSTIMCVSLNSPSPSISFLKTEHRAPTQRPRVKIIQSRFRPRLPRKPELTQCQALAILKQ